MCLGTGVKFSKADGYLQNTDKKNQMPHGKTNNSVKKEFC